MGLSSEAAASATETFGRRDWLFAAALVVAVFLLYQPAWHGKFILDDEFSVLDNSVFKPGSIARIWEPGVCIRYWPLTFTVFRLEYALWGQNVLGFHLVNLALHALAA